MDNTEKLDIDGITWTLTQTEPPETVEAVLTDTDEDIQIRLRAIGRAEELAVEADTYISDAKACLKEYIEHGGDAENVSFRLAERSLNHVKTLINVSVLGMDDLREEN